VPHVTRVLGNEGQVTLLPDRRQRRDPGHGCHKRLVICPELKLPAFNLRQKMVNGRLGGQQLTVEGGVVLLCRRQPTGKEAQWLPMPPHLLLQDPTYAAFFLRSSGAMGTWWKAFTKSILEKTVQPSMLAGRSIRLGKGYLSGTVMVLRRQ
jgi:hypothetical protein